MKQKLSQLSSGIERDSATPTAVTTNDGRNLLGTNFNLNDYVLALGEDNSYQIILIKTSYSTDQLSRKKSFDQARVRYFGEYELAVDINGFQRQLQELASRLHNQRENDSVTVRNASQLPSAIMQFF